MPDVASFTWEGTLASMNANQYLQLNKITDAYKYMIQFEYSSLSNENIYQSKAGPTSYYPAIEFVEGHRVIKTMQVPDGAGGVNKTTFKYHGFRMDVKGRGGLGFSKIDSSTGRPSFVRDFLQI